MTTPVDAKPPTAADPLTPEQVRTLEVVLTPSQVMMFNDRHPDELAEVICAIATRLRASHLAWAEMCEELSDLIPDDESADKPTEADIELLVRRCLGMSAAFVTPESTALARRLASAEQCVANIREIVGHSINLSSPLECTVSAIVAAKADAEARLAKVREAMSAYRDRGGGLCAWAMTDLPKELAAALGGTDAGGDEREAGR